MPPQGQSPVSRRAVLGITLTGLTSVAGVERSSAQDGAARLGAIRVDTTPLAAIGGRGPAQVIADVLPRKLAVEFATVVSPNDAHAPVLVARIDRLYLASFAGQPGSGIDSFGSMDSMEGAGLVTSGRQLISTTPLRVTLPAGYSGAYYLPDIDVRRIASLCDSFASWLRREMNL